MSIKWGYTWGTKLKFYYVYVYNFYNDTLSYFSLNFCIKLVPDKYNDKKNTEYIKVYYLKKSI